MEWRIYPLDVLFFRGMQPMNAGESAVVQGQFPPSPEVMQGFVRTALLKALNVSFDDYALAALGANNASETARHAVAMVGRPPHTGIAPDDDLGQLVLSGPYLVRTRDESVERWYPAPLDLWKPPESDVWRQGKPSEPVESDLGLVRLVSLGNGEAAADKWISEDGLRRYLRGGEVSTGQMVDAITLYVEERRVGIARDHTSRATREGMLYAPIFVRLKERGEDGAGPTGIGLRVSGIEDDLQRRCAGVHRLGGEGRLVGVEIHDEPEASRPANIGPLCRLIFLSPVRWGGDWLPPGFD